MARSEISEADLRVLADYLESFARQVGIGSDIRLTGLLTLRLGEQ